MSAVFARFSSGLKEMATRTDKEVNKPIKVWRKENVQKQLEKHRNWQEALMQFDAIFIAHNKMA